MIRIWLGEPSSEPPCNDFWGELAQRPSHSEHRKLCALLSHTFSICITFAIGSDRDSALHEVGSLVRMEGPVVTSGLLDPLSHVLDQLLTKLAKIRWLAKSIWNKDAEADDLEPWMLNGAVLHFSVVDCSRNLTSYRRAKIVIPHRIFSFRYCWTPRHHACDWRPGFINWHSLRHAGGRALSYDPEEVRGKALRSLRYQSLHNIDAWKAFVPSRKRRSNIFCLFDLYCCFADEKYQSWWR